ncbi:MAG: hypothetical protein M3235_18585 [Actinomycetota bacterium]|nr:hypothetical protein [Actinomycetota bacterium]
MAGEHGHDYTYDLAHEMQTIAPVPQPRRGASRAPATGTAPRELDPDTDFGHDCAHEEV